MKAQSRMEMYTFAEKVRTLGPEAAAKSRPSNLSIEVWRLMENIKRNDGETDRSDDSSQDNENPVNRTTIHAILDKLLTEALATDHNIKIEENNDMEDENSNSEMSQNQPDDVSPQKRSRIMENKPVDLAEQKSACPDSVSTSHIDDVEHCDLATELSSASMACPTISNKNKWLQREMWIFKSTQREHEIKLKMLNIELERANLQRQAAINELKTSEIKRQLMEDQASDYYSQVRMAGERGSGAGKGGGGGGTIREAGGSFGKMEAAHEDQYFYNLQKEQLQKMRESLHDEISFHEEQIKRHQEAINRHKKRISDMDEKQ